MIPPKTLKAINESRTIFKKQVKSARYSRVSILKRADSNPKLGNGSYLIEKVWNGFPLYYLTLEQRATCPKSCHHWNDCYGNNSFRAIRYKNDDFLIPKLKKELATLQLKYPNGFAVRLHVLGDFYSVAYVKFWSKMLEENPALHIYGYTARNSGPIYEAIKKYLSISQKVILRHSTSLVSLSKLNSSFAGLNLLAVDGSYPEQEVIVCPEQLSKTDSCLTCGLCFNKNVTKPIKFLTH